MGIKLVKQEASAAAKQRHYYSLHEDCFLHCWLVVHVLTVSLLFHHSPSFAHIFSLDSFLALQSILPERQPTHIVIKNISIK